MRSTILSCNAGELSPKMLSRIDVDQYQKGCKKLQNFFVTPYGAIERRKGTEFIGYSEKQNVRLIRFVFSSAINYLLELGDRYIRIYNKGILLDQKLVTPYDSADLAKIKYIQSADVMILVHPKYPVYELKRVETDKFTFSEKVFKYPPMLDINIDDDHCLSISSRTGEVTFPKGETVYLHSSKDLFSLDSVGETYQLTHVRVQNELNVDFTGNWESDVIEIYGGWTFSTHGTWGGVLRILRSEDLGETWEIFKSCASAEDSNYIESFEEEGEQIYYKLHMSGYSQSGAGTMKFCRAQIFNPEFMVKGVVKVNRYIDAQKCEGTILSRIYSSDETNEWAQGAFSKKNGYPVTVAFYEERLILAGSSKNPNRIFFSRSNEWDNFLIGANATDGIDITLSSDTVNEIAWVLSQNALVIGTLDSEWILSTVDGSPLSPANLPGAMLQSVYGSAPMSAFLAGDTVLFVQRKNRKLREFIYSNDRQGYAVSDLTAMAEHITESGIKEVAVQQLPDTIIWCVLNDGTVATLTYERSQGVIGWAKQFTDGEVVSLTILPTADGEDEIYWAVRRNGKVQIEKMSLRSSDNYIDCKGNLNCAYESIYSPMPIEAQIESGTTLHLRKKISAITCRVYDSVGGVIQVNGGKAENIIARDIMADNFDTEIIRKSEVIEKKLLGEYVRETDIEIRQSEALPLNIASITVTYDVCE